MNFLLLNSKLQYLTLLYSDDAVWWHHQSTTVRDACVSVVESKVNYQYLCIQWDIAIQISHNVFTLQLQRWRAAQHRCIGYRLKKQNQKSDVTNFQFLGLQQQRQRPDLAERSFVPTGCDLPCAVPRRDPPDLQRGWRRWRFLLRPHRRLCWSPDLWTPAGAPPAWGPCRQTQVMHMSLNSGY